MQACPRPRRCSGEFRWAPLYAARQAGGGQRAAWRTAGVRRTDSDQAGQSLYCEQPTRGNIMPVRTSYTQGTPNWVDLQTPSQDAAKAFYSGLFGWTYDDQPMPDGPVYSMAMLGEHPVAAIAPQPPEMAAAGAPPMWTTYLAVDSVDDAVAKAEAAGGKVAMAPFDVMDAGRMAFVMDPSGAGVALWQANQHNGG